MTEIEANEPDYESMITELREIARVCQKISRERPESFREAVQLLWFVHLGTIIVSFEFVNYGRLDVILGPFLGEMPREEALELLECFLLEYLQG